MTRQEEIEQAGQAWVKAEPNGNFGMLRGFYKGAMWADSHRWISSKDALPESDGVYLTFLPYVGIRVIKFKQGKWMLFNKELPNGMPFYYWMPIPPITPPRKEDEK